MYLFGLLRSKYDDIIYKRIIVLFTFAGHIHNKNEHVDNVIKTERPKGGLAGDGSCVW